MPMDLLRTPQLAGKTVVYEAYGAVRGSVRRTNPDGTSSSPYFPISAGGTLILQFDGTANRTATFATANMTVAAILSTINAAISGVGVASELDGAISIRTATAGTAGSVEVTGGTSATTLGFDLKNGPIFATGGGPGTALEGRQNNPYTTVFPVDSENLNTKSFRRAFVKMAAGVDVLYADLLKKKARVEKVHTVASVTAVSGATGVYRVDLPSNIVIHNGLGLLSRLSTPEELSAFFGVVDPVTGLPSQSRVVAVVQGSVTGPAPYADAAAYPGTGNVLGLNLPRGAAITIDEIRDGRIIYAAAGFSNAAVGDFCEINGVAGTIVKTPWDNRGMRWAVEWVSADFTSVALRPLSYGELAQLGVVSKETHPIVSLNSTKQVSDTWGTARFYSGPSITGGVGLIVSPAPPVGAEIWAAVPVTVRGEQGKDESAGYGLGNRLATGNNDILPNCVLTRPTLSAVGAVLTVPEFYVRLHGKYVRIPQTTITQSAFFGGSIVWDEVQGVILVSGSLSSTQHLLGTGAVPSGSWANLVTVTRIEAAIEDRAIVRVPEQCATIQEAINFLSAVNKPGKIIVSANQTAPSGGWQCSASSNADLEVEGVNPGIVLTHGATGPLFVTSSRSLLLANFSADMTKTLFSGGAGIVRVTNIITTTPGVGSTDKHIDVSNALEIGATYATSVDISRPTKTTNVRGGLSVAENTLMLGTLSVGGLATLGNGLALSNPGDAAVYGGIELIERTWKRFGRYGTVADPAVTYFYKANIITTVRNGRPNVAKLSMSVLYWNSPTGMGALEGVILPTAHSDNIEEMLYAQIDWYKMSTAWDGISTYGGTLTNLNLTTRHPVQGRGYWSATVNDPLNASKFYAQIASSSISGFAACKVTLYNIFGPSDTYWFVYVAADAPALRQAGITGMPLATPDVYLTPATQTVYVEDGMVADFTISAGTGTLTFSEVSDPNGGAWVSGTLPAVALPGAQTNTWTPVITGTYPQTVVVRVTDSNGKTADATITVLGTYTGGGGGGTCPTVDSPFTLADGSQLEGGKLKVGMKLWTRPENGAQQYGAYEITAIETRLAELVEVEFTDGRVQRCSKNHLFCVNSSFVEIQNLQKGWTVDGTTPGVVAEVRDTGEVGDVVKVSVRGAKTYVVNGLLSHNEKPL